ncbi:MAG: YcfL family protein [Verrucomicrobia bacterium]|nr:YcfL family protein [Verrucomicrobiota bacterium]MBU4292133.1 YcfL family protein [Verrucomicrobiota bacterium]MBU4428930.1 YcfL family protein [Verrucomicrobiota bacterium]MBU4498476.1 YcfL family protein [Verrucomicrobiota bacterium]MCG2680797.1 YcfL family protein [Kiritimatiellia bacterium]
MNTYSLILGMLLIGAVLTTGCRTPSAGVTVESYPHNKISVNSKLFGGWMTVTEISAAKKNDLLQAQITAQNTATRDCQFEYRFRWLDKNGMEVSTPMVTWVQVSVSAKEKALMRGIAPNKEVEDFDFIVRFLRTSARW